MRHNLYIQGKYINISLAKITHLCIHCLAKLKQKGFGLQCSVNDNHYGFMHRKEAATITQEERFMKIGEMFKSEYLRGIDVGQPMKLTIKAVSEEMARSVRTDKVEPEYVMYFEETPKKLRLNLTMAKACADIIDDPDMDTDNWLGKVVTVYRTTVKAFGQEHIVPRIRKVKKGDKSPAVTARFETPDDMLYEINREVGYTEDEARAVLKHLGFNGFKPSVSGEMYQAAIAFAMEGNELPLEEDEQPVLIEGE